jgi:hypothetical protein
MVKKYAVEASAALMAITAVIFLMMSANILTFRADAASAVLSNQTIVRIDQTGTVLVRGTIDSITPGTIVVKSWGGNWTANIGVATQILPAVAGDDIAQFKPGDYVGIQGTVDGSANWTINATLARDWTYKAAAAEEKKQNVAAAREAALSAPKNYVGTASGVNGQTFMLLVKGVADTVNVAADAEVVNRNWITLPIANIRDGDTVRVWGVNASGTIAATIVRDVTLPATSTAVQVPSF